jgi:hypothetical protein
LSVRSLSRVCLHRALSQLWLSVTCPSLFVFRQSACEGFVSKTMLDLLLHAIIINSPVK